MNSRAAYKENLLTSSKASTRRPHRQAARARQAGQLRGASKEITQNAETTGGLIGSNVSQEAKNLLQPILTSSPSNDEKGNR